MLKHADIAMYNVKGMGRNNFQAYVAVPEESHQQCLSLETKLRVAERTRECHRQEPDCEHRRCSAAGDWPPCDRAHGHL